MSGEANDRIRSRERSLVGRLSELAEGITAELAGRLRRLAWDATDVSLSIRRAIFSEPPNPKLAREAGASLRELRQLAGLTVEELTDAVNLEDRTLLQAVEDGTATLSFELVLRLAAILARHDPVPFLIRFTRTYNPEVWRVLEDFGAGRLPLHFERERRFINIYRGQDSARKLSDDGFARVLDFTRAAFEFALHFAADEEAATDEKCDDDADSLDAAGKSSKASSDRIVEQSPTRSGLGPELRK